MSKTPAGEAPGEGYPKAHQRLEECRKLENSIGAFTTQARKIIALQDTLPEASRFAGDEVTKIEDVISRLRVLLLGLERSLGQT